ncbi:MAG: BREX-1 system adenine-specific DNA-methyltransferase PglX, partial [Beijerinckiaceae bacterium]|nr:BREX-1 system adenine-specific DNA-methyltransferase PglX [Beijerinckiaceae bacterium]
MNQYLPDQLRYLKHPLSRYEAPKANNFDLYLVFLERCLELLSRAGRLGMIIPNRFTSHLSGTGVR